MKKPTNWKYLLPLLLICFAPLNAMEAEPVPEPAVQTSSAARPVERTEPASATTPSPSVAPRAQDRIELDTTQITGNRELPRVLYVVPWKQSDLGDLARRPTNSLLDEVLSPVDRDVFRRQSRYYEALRPDATGSRSEAEK